MAHSPSGGQSINVPPYFLCPISLQTMRDPVTLSTGITYERQAIEKWIFSKEQEKHPICPVTKLPLAGVEAAELTPNHTLRRLIQAWCAAHASEGVERFPTPKPPVDKAQIAKIIDEARRGPQSQMRGYLGKIRIIVEGSERNRRCAEAAGVPNFLISVVRTRIDNRTPPSDGEASSRRWWKKERTSSPSIAGDVEEALLILNSLQMSPLAVSELVLGNPDLADLLTAVLKSGDCHRRAHAIFLLDSILEALDPQSLFNSERGLCVELVNVVRDHTETKKALRCLSRLCHCPRNQVKASEAGGAGVLVELLLNETQRSVCEMALVVLEQLSSCAEGRADVLCHPAGIALVSKKILRVSPLATDRAVRVLNNISKHAATPVVVEEMMHVGVVSKLFLLLQMNCGDQIRRKANEILRQHMRAWKNSPCIPSHLLSLYSSLPHE